MVVTVRKYWVRNEFNCDTSASSAQAFWTHIKELHAGLDNCSDCGSWRTHRRQLLFAQGRPTCTEMHVNKAVWNVSKQYQPQMKVFISMLLQQCFPAAFTVAFSSSFSIFLIFSRSSASSRFFTSSPSDAFASRALLAKQVQNSSLI